MVRSLFAHATREVQVEVIDGDGHCTRNALSGRTVPLPDAWRGRIRGSTAFSFARFAPPALTGFGGRAIYCECDMLALGDIAELWDHAVDGPFAAVPHAAQRGAASPFQRSGFMSSVIVFDSTRCRALDIVSITDRIRDGRLEYQDAISLTDRFLSEMGIDVAPLPAMWNDLERPLGDTKILHFTDFDRRPWLHPGQPGGRLWTDAYIDCVRDGVLDEEQLRAARRAGNISMRVASLPRIPARYRPAVDATWQRFEQAQILVGQMIPNVRRFARRVVRRLLRLWR